MSFIIILPTPAFETVFTFVLTEKANGQIVQFPADLPLLEIALVLVRFNHVARVIVNANQSIV
jgi:hypothetical protein